MIANRRGFLRGLATLPLVGGSVQLIGAPSAVAEPVTTDLLYSYMAFTAWEHAAAYYAWERSHYEGRVTTRRGEAPMFWFPEHKGATDLVTNAPAEARAALVLTAVGVDWRRG